MLFNIHYNRNKKANFQNTNSLFQKGEMGLLNGFHMHFHGLLTIAKHKSQNRFSYKIIIILLTLFIIFLFPFNARCILTPTWYKVNSTLPGSLTDVDNIAPEQWYEIKPDTTPDKYIFTAAQIKEGCFKCHVYMYPDITIKNDSSKKIDIQGFSNNNEYSYPLLFSKNSTNINSEYYPFKHPQRLGHLSHIVRQPFGLGRNCLDCHNSYYSSQEHRDQKEAGLFIYFRTNEKNENTDEKATLSSTDICTTCHGGYYPKERNPQSIYNTNINASNNPNEKINPNNLTILEWGNPSTVECLHCHDDSIGNGGIYASYFSRYSNDSAVNWSYADDKYSEDNRELKISAPDPDQIPGENFWNKNGHGVYSCDLYKGALLDIGYPDKNSPTSINYPNSGAMQYVDSNNREIVLEPTYIKARKDEILLDIGVNESEILLPTQKFEYSNSDYFKYNIKYNPTDPNKAYFMHDINLDPYDGGKNFCWECHWSNISILNRITNHFRSYAPMGKYNGHLDTICRDERWGDADALDPCHAYFVNGTCYKCHEGKFSHANYPTGSGQGGSLARRNIIVPQEENSIFYCIACHNPHGTGDPSGKSNIFMIKGQIYKNHCNNCHYSQYYENSLDLIVKIKQPKQEDRKPVIFFNAFQQDMDENNTESKDICETCHIGINSNTAPSHNGKNHKWNGNIL